MQVQKPVLLESMKISQNDHAKMMFSDPCTSSGKDFIKVNGSYNPLTKQLIEEEAQFYAVTEATTMKELKSKWYQNNVQQNQQLQNIGEDKYICMWQDIQPLYDYMTIGDVKRKFGIESFSGKDLIRIYYVKDCNFKEDESAVDFGVLEKQYFKQIDVTFKLISQDIDKGYYFYLKLNISSTIQQLKSALSEYIKNTEKCPFKYDPQLGYNLYIEKDSILKNNEKIIDINKIGSQFIQQARLKRQLVNFSKIPNVDKRKIRDICPPGQIIFIQPKVPNKVVDKISQTKFDPTINIICYQVKNDYENSYLAEKRITRKYSKIHYLKVNTLLKEEKIFDYLFTSLYYAQKGFLLRPNQHFSKLQGFLKNSSEKQIVLTMIPQNILFYKQIISLAKNKIEMTHLLDYFQNEKNIKFNNTDRKTCQQVRTQRIQTVQDKQHKTQDFLDPLILYTSQHIYRKLNQLLRKTTVSWLDISQLTQLSEKFWHYPFCQKLLKSLNKLPNFNGTVYRGSSQYDYDYKQGQIIEWNCFNSTSKKIETARAFLKQKIPYIFQIQSFSGKQIHPYSYFSVESQVLLMPYTRFKVVKVEKRLQTFSAYKVQNGKHTIQQRKLKITFVKLLQIPIPKKYPANLVVWIDPNIHENSLTYNSIIKANKHDNFDLIQLKSNEHFKTWLNQFNQILSLKSFNIHFITNMNRPPNYNQEGIQTLEIIRSFRPNSTVVFYIGNVQKARQLLKKKLDDKNLQIVQDPNVLLKIFATKFNKNLNN